MTVRIAKRRFAILARCSIVGLSCLSMFLISASNVHAGGRFPQTADDYAVLYEMRLYDQLRGNSAEFRRRVKVAKQIMRDYKKNEGAANEQAAINWFVTASQSGSFPAAPAFSSQSSIANAAPAIQAPAATEPVKPEYGWDDQNSSPKEDRVANTPAKTAEPESDMSDLFAESESGADAEAWSENDVDDAFGEKDWSESNESLVAGDPAAASVLKKSNQTPSLPSETDSADVADLADVWGEESGNESADVSSTLSDLAAAASKSLPMEALPGSGDEQSKASVEDIQTAAGESTDALGNAASDIAGAVDTAWGTDASAEAAVSPLSGGPIPMALLGGQCLFGLGSLYGWIMQMVASFKNKKPLFGILSLVTCGFAGLIIGWVKHREWGITKTMKIWTGCMIGSVVASVASMFMAF